MGKVRPISKSWFQCAEKHTTNKVYHASTVRYDHTWSILFFVQTHNSLSLSRTTIQDMRFLINRELHAEQNLSSLQCCTTYYKKSLFTCLQRRECDERPEPQVKKKTEEQEFELHLMFQRDFQDLWHCLWRHWWCCHCFPVQDLGDHQSVSHPHLSQMSSKNMESEHTAESGKDRRHSMEQVNKMLGWIGTVPLTENTFSSNIPTQKGL